MAAAMRTSTPLHAVCVRARHAASAASPSCAAAGACQRRCSLRRASRRAMFVSSGAAAAQLADGVAHAASTNVMHPEALLAASLPQPLFQVATLDPATASAVAGGLGPLLSVGTLLFIIRYRRHTRVATNLWRTC